MKELPYRSPRRRDAQRAREVARIGIMSHSRRIASNLAYRMAWALAPGDGDLWALVMLFNCDAVDGVSFPQISYEVQQIYWRYRRIDPAENIGTHLARLAGSTLAALAWKIVYAARVHTDPDDLEALVGWEYLNSYELLDML